MTFWSSQTLAQKLPTLISPCDPSKIKEASYELRIGSEIYVSKDYHDNNSQHTKRLLTENEPFTIPPGQFAFLLTEECVEVPRDAIAFISMKAKLKFKGLVNISGFHVDPGYSGKLLFSVHNAGPSTIHLQQGMPIFLIWYSNLDYEDSQPRNKEGLSEIPSQDLSTETIYSMQTLTTRMTKIETEFSSIDSLVKTWGKILKSLGWIIMLVVPSGIAIYIYLANEEKKTTETSALIEIREEQRKLFQAIENLKIHQDAIETKNTPKDDQSK